MFEEFLAELASLLGFSPEALRPLMNRDGTLNMDEFIDLKSKRGWHPLPEEFKHVNFETLEKDLSSTAKLLTENDFPLGAELDREAQAAAAEAAVPGSIEELEAKDAMARSVAREQGVSAAFMQQIQPWGFSTDQETAELFAQILTDQGVEDVTDQNVFRILSTGPNAVNQTNAVIDQALGDAQNDYVVFGRLGQKPLTIEGAVNRQIIETVPAAGAVGHALYAAAEAGGVPAFWLAIAAEQSGYFKRTGRERFLDPLGPTRQGLDVVSASGAPPPPVGSSRIGGLSASGSLEPANDEPFQGTTRSQKDELDASGDRIVPPLEQRDIEGTSHYRNLFDLADDLAARAEEFGSNYYLALISLQDRALAYKLMEDRPKITEAEAVTKDRVLKHITAESQTRGTVNGMTRLESHRLTYLKNLGSADFLLDGVSASGELLVLPDQGSQDEALRTLFRGWFQRDPSKAEFARFRKQQNDEVRGEFERRQVGENPNGASFWRSRVDLPGDFRRETPNSVAAKEFARNSPDYNTLFSNMPAGSSEGEYVAQFINAVGNESGGAIDNRAVRAGQVTGDLNTAVGLASNNQLASGGTSDYRRRLALAARTVAART